MLQDVVPHFGRSRGGKGGGLRPADPVQRLAQPQVVRPEIVAPLTQTVRLVDGEEGDFHLLQRREKRLVAEALRRHVDQLEPSVAKVAQAVALLGPRDGAVDERGGDPAPLQRLHLILHQAHERTDHDGHAVATQRRN